MSTPAIVSRVWKLAERGIDERHVTFGSIPAGIEQLSVLCGPFAVVQSKPRPLSLAAFVAEFCFGAINYSYWFDAGDPRPVQGAATVRKVVFNSFGLPAYPDGTEEAGNATEPEVLALVERAVDAVAALQLPLAAERSIHIREVAQRIDVVRLLRRQILDDGDPGVAMETLHSNFPGFAEDPFFKRGFLLLALTERLYGHGSRIAAATLLPSDYQVPKVLRAAGILRYSPELAAKVDGAVLLPEGGPEETAIRAASIVAARRVSEALGTIDARVDDWLWNARKRVPDLYHLTRTSRY